MARSIVASIKLSGIFLLACVCSVVAQAQIITTVAGTGVWGYTGDGVPATASGVSNPHGICVDTADNVYFSDWQASRVRKITPAGIITTIAGNGTAGYSGDGGPATAAEIFGTQDVATDKLGNVYITDMRNNRVRKIDASGIITTVAGSGPAWTTSSRYSGEGGPATNAVFTALLGITSDAVGNLYLTDGQDTTYIRKISTSGIITTIAGTNTDVFGGDGGPATGASLHYVWFLRLDGAGNLYLPDAHHQRIRKINTAGIITTIAGNGTAAYTGDGMAATATSLTEAYGVATDAAGNVYIADNNYRIRKVNTAGIISTIAGNGLPAYYGDNVVCSKTPYTSEVNELHGITTNSRGSVIFCDWANSRIRKISNNESPLFAGGHKLQLGLCKNAGATTVNTLLTINDNDAGQSEQWSPLTAPTHGAAVVTYTVTSTGGTLIPAGLTYTPDAGYVGADSFKVVVADCLDSTDTAMVYVTIDTMPTVAAITGVIDTVCKGASIRLSDASAGGMWVASSGKVSVTAGTVTGLAAGMDTVRYIVTNSCSSAVASFVVRVSDCIKNTAGLINTQDKIASLSVQPNPGNGTFSVLLTSAVNEQMQLTVTDITGKQIMETTGLTNKAGTINLHVPSGVYFLTARTAKGKYEAKVIVNP